MATITPVTREDVDNLCEHFDLSRENLAEILRTGHEDAVKNGEWRTLADHVLGLMAGALKKRMSEDRDALREAHSLALYWLRGYERDDEYATHAKRVLENASLLKETAREAKA